MSSSINQKDLIAALAGIVGKRHVLTSARKLRRYCEGYRTGRGPALAIVRPGTLVEQWQVADLCVKQGCVIIMQAANTGLTGGSTPNGEYDRPVVVINTMRLKGIQLVEDGRQAICLPGSTLYELDRLLEPIGREPHSEIGSSCLGATVHGGICNSSGGALVRRGPAYTEAALFGRVRDTGELELVNHLGIELEGDPVDVLSALDNQQIVDVKDTAVSKCSRRDYVHHVRQLDAETPARFNADPGNLFETSGSAGKLILFAVRVDTFERARGTRVIHIATNFAEDLTEVKARLLAQDDLVPIAAEYMHRDMWQTATRYARDMFAAINMLGTNRLPAFFAFKSGFDRIFSSLPLPIRHPSDRFLQMLGRLLPQGLPKRAQRAGRDCEHHLLLKIDGAQIASVKGVLDQMFSPGSGKVTFCSTEEGRKLFLQRFVAAGAAIRYDILHARQKPRLISLDIALKRSDRDWHHFLPQSLSRRVSRELVYGHFFCNVLHLDFIARPEEDAERLKADILAWYSGRGAEYPAEHNVGHEYAAPPTLVAFYRELDPKNVLNPGIGKTSKAFDWGAHEFAKIYVRGAHDGPD